MLNQSMASAIVSRPVQNRPASFLAGYRLQKEIT